MILSFFVVLYNCQLTISQLTDSSFDRISSFDHVVCTKLEL